MSFSIYQRFWILVWNVNESWNCQVSILQVCKKGTGLLVEEQKTIQTFKNVYNVSLKVLLEPKLALKSTYIFNLWRAKKIFWICNTLKVTCFNAKQNWQLTDGNSLIWDISIYHNSFFVGRQAPFKNQEPFKNLENVRVNKSNTYKSKSTRTVIIKYGLQSIHR